MGSGRKITNSQSTFRKRMGFSQRDVAKNLQLKDTAIISRWEKGLTMPSARNLFRLSLLYHCLPDQLYFNYRNELKTELALHPESGVIISQSQLKDARTSKRKR